jgi:type IV pilus assembly protein PilQ
VASRGGAPADPAITGGLGASDPIAALNLQALAAPQAAAAQAPATPPAQQPPAQAAPPPAPPAPATQTAGRNTARQYTGTPVSFDFQDADLRAVLRTFHEITGLNIVIDPTVQGTVNTALTDVPWDQALDIILRANKLGYIVDGTIVRIAPLTALADEETQRRKLADEQALSGELRVTTKTLSYANAVQVAPLLTKSVLSQRGTVQVDQRTNTLIITDLQARLAAADELLASLDTPQRQVEIEARIVQANTNYARALGVQWGFNGRVDPTLGNTTALAFPNNGSLRGNVGTTTGGGADTAVNLPAPAATSAVALALGSVNGAFNLDVALSAAETSGKLRILSTPRVSTQNNGEAEITQGTQIPVPTIANNTVTVAFKDAALQLKVTPQITAVGTVIMKITLENSQPDFSRAVNGIPPINTQRAITQVLVNDGETTVIGGIYASQEQVLNDRTPGLSRIPLLSWLFKRDTLNDQSTELLIFITPRIQKG